MYKRPPSQAEMLERKRLRKKATHRKSNLKRKYGLTEDEFDELKQFQGGVCAICLRDKPLQVDHEHRTGRTRGLLCGPCNRALGLFKDDMTTVQRALKYLAS